MSSITIPSDTKKICTVEHFLNDLSKKHDISRKVYCKVYLSVTEAVVNAILHGNKNDTNKKVHVAFEKVDKDIAFTIEDEGCGFNYHNIPDAIHPNNLLNESGRGIFIMKQYSDIIEYNECGNAVKLTFKNN